ncbi:hypothetical protein GS498_19025 [Rhodococcus hoagii]|nr:hypothetical protein [Prescottella equi]
MSDGDIVVSPNRSDRTVRIGRICGPYEYRPENSYKHWRPVEWLIPRISRDDLSEAAQNELSSATTLFKLRTARPEIEPLLDDSQSTPGEADFTWVSFYSELATNWYPSAIVATNSLPLSGKSRSGPVQSDCSAT